MAITTTCSGCGKTLAVADEFAGRQARCPQCGQIYTVPQSSQQPAASAPPDTTPLTLGDPYADPYSRPEPVAPQKDLPASYWMKAANGQEYGPVDSATLGRWFSEGRVGAGYMIRTGEYGTWQPASDFQTASVPNSSNPFAAYPTGAGLPTQQRQYPKADQSGLVLAMGILAWIGFCPIFGIIAWVVGSHALRDMQQGTADPTNRGLVQVGYYLGMISVILSVCCFAFYVVVIAIMTIS